MKFLFYILAIVALILLFPIPIKINLIFEKGIFTLKIFNKTVIPTSPSTRKKDKLEKNEKFIKTPSGEKISKLKFEDIKHLLSFLNNTKLKFFLWTNTTVNYSIDDAALNAICYGLLQQVSALLHGFLNLFFNVKKYKASIFMKYNENFFKLENSSIILLNVATIIYMIIRIYYDYIERRDTSSKYEY